MRAFAHIVAAAALVLAACGRGPGLPDDADDDGAGGQSAGGAGAGGTSDCAGSGVITGNYFATLSIYLDPGSPIVFDAVVDAGGSSFSMTLNALDAEDRMTVVGAPVVVGPCPIAADRTFTCTVEDVTLVAEANPITCSDVVADMTLTGSLCDAAVPGFVCGGVMGITTAQTRLDGSTFTMEQLVSPGAYPEQPKINCAGDPANALPTGCS